MRGFGDISDPLDSINASEASFWNLDVNNTAIVTNPVTGTGSVLQLNGNGGGISMYHTFNAPMYGTVSMDLYMQPQGGPHQYEEMMLDNVNIAAKAVQTTAGTPVQYSANGNTAVQPLDMSGWHTFSISLNGMVANTYIDGVLYGTTALNAGFRTVDIAFWDVCNDAYVSNFNYSPITPVPEPSTWVLLSVGLLVMGGFIARKKRAC
jgi:hypothetical protein